MCRDHCTRKNNGLCSFGPNARMVVPSSSACGIAPFPRAEVMDTNSENPLTAPAVHVQHAAVLHNVLFRVPAPAATAISAYEGVWLPQIVLNHLAYGAIMRPFSVSGLGRIRANSLLRAIAYSMACHIKLPGERLDSISAKRSQIHSECHRGCSLATEARIRGGITRHSPPEHISQSAARGHRRATLHR